MADQVKISRLIEFGMTEREARIYLALLEKHEASAADIHRLSGVLRTKTYETLHQMVTHGYCYERKEGRNRFFHAVPPNELLEALQHRWDMERSRLKKAADETFSDLDKVYQQSQSDERPMDIIEVIRTVSQIHQRYSSLIRSSDKEILSLVRSPYACLEPEILAEQEAVQADAMRRGVISRALYMLEDDSIQWLHESLGKMLVEGESARVHLNLPMKFFIFDRKKVLLALPSIPGQTMADFTMVVIEDKGFTLSCLKLFETLWEEAQDIEEWEKEYQEQLSQEV